MSAGYATRDTTASHHHQPDGPWEFLADRLPAMDLTAAALAGAITPAVDLPQVAGNGPALSGQSAATGDVIANGEGAALPEPYASLARCLYRRTQGHVLLTGDDGVGKTTIVRELARLAAECEIPFLAGRRFLWLDCSNIGPEDSRACLETILAVAAELPGAVLCLDGLAALLRRPSGGTNIPLLRAAAARPGLRIIGILSRHEFSELIGADSRLLELFARIEIDEPSEETALAIARQAADGLSREYRLSVSDEVVRRAVGLTGSFLLNERHPARAIRVLRRCCEEADYERTQLGRERTEVTADDVTGVVSELTGIPEETLAGETGQADFARALEAAVVGQPEAVEAAARELRLIRAGLSDPDKPAAVLLFAGMTGVGKTELAKRIAGLYSTSKKLQTYTMGNFTEPHSVSGIIGVPPGYVGHEHGGRLINELNADPYAVFLLDEAEKAHPNVWKPFLNLFDEGWIVDQRGVRAHADRAIFILTTNAGDRTIQQMAARGASPEEIAERVKQTLSKIRQERSSQPVFTPQFLPRIGRVVVFQPLDEAAMTGIAERQLERICETWQRRREKTVEVPHELTQAIGRRAHELNGQPGGQEGGRIVRRLISDLVESPIQQAGTDDPEAYRKCRRIVLSLAEPTSEPTGEGEDSPPELKAEQVLVELVQEEAVSADS